MSLTSFLTAPPRDRNSVILIRMNHPVKAADDARAGRPPFLPGTLEKNPKESIAESLSLHRSLPTLRVLESVA